ncbi:MAG: hypothetical protein MUO35_12935 [Anaerolineales bacterium]|nr:hypothetical protein [Anaerolineales bacterium]
MIAQVEHAPRSAFRYWFDDGLVEIGVGLLFLALMALFAVESLAPAESLPAGFSAFGLPVIVIGGMIVLGLALRVIKERLTFPRTGYVAYPRPAPTRRILAGVIGAGVSLVIVWLLAARPSLQLALGALQGAALAIVFLALSLRTGLLRLAIPGFAALAAGLVATFASLQSSQGSAITFGAAGATTLLTGSLVLAHYLRTTAPPAEA